MKVIIQRKYYKENYTIGKLFIDNEYICDTLEDRIRKTGEKIFGKTCISPNLNEVEHTYKVIICNSPKFKHDLPLLLNVPSFEGVRIHKGNTALDTEGCILLGYNKEKGKVINSTDAFDLFISKLQGLKEFELTIYN